MVRALLARAAAQVDVAVVRLAQTLAGGARPAAREARVASLEATARDYAAIGPERLFAAPPPLAGMREERVRRLGGEVVDLSWESGYVPRSDEVREKYLSYAENRIARARLLRHGSPRPALICLHGYRAGMHAFEEIAWRARRLHRLGLDVALLTLPFHALRAPRGRRPAPVWPSNNTALTIEGFGQALWDLRALLGWLHARGAPFVGLFGMSLGGYTAALACTVEPRIDCGVLYIPLGDLTSVAVEHEALRGTTVPMYLSDAARSAVEIVRPLSRPPLVARDRMLVVAAEADRITPVSTHAQKLAAHFGAPLVRFPGSHLVQLGRSAGFSAIEGMLARLGAIQRHTR
jgi:dienelactone hydrolase